MTTKVWPAGNKDAMAEAARILREGGIVAFPTETVYGLGGDARCPDAIRKIYEAKGRPGDNPLIVHVADTSGILPLIRGGITAEARALADAFWPGPMTLIFPKSDLVPDCVTAGLDTVAIRMPSHPAARELIRLSGCPVAAPSANTSGRPSPTCARHVFEDMDGKIPLILDGGDAAVGVESTVIALDGGKPVVLRPGGITPEMIKGVLGSVGIDKGVMSPVDPGTTPRSPGMKYRHYAPRCRVRVFRGDAEEVAKAIAAEYDAAEHPLILCRTDHIPLYGGRNCLPMGRDASDAAHVLFDELREADERGADLVLAEGTGEEGVGLAFMNRLGRAASFDITDLQ